MPLLTSPIDGLPMRQIHRYGIEIDVCPTTGGIWLDKGELEKLIHLLQEEAAVEQPNRPPVKTNARYEHDDDDWDDDDRRYQKKGYYGTGKYRKKEGKVSRIMDLLDF